MAEFVSVYMPPPRPQLTEGTLPELSPFDVHPSRLHALRTFLRNPRASFTCPQQGMLIELIVRGEEHVLAVLSTNVGKTTSILMISKMYAPTKTIIYVLPLRALHSEIVRRASHVGVSAATWEPKGPSFNHVNILTVSIEHVGHPEFLE